MNDPFPCETTVEGVACSGHATHVFRTAYATRLICDACAAAYRLAARGPRKTAIVEFTLLEFIPAREYLRGQVETMRAERDVALDNERRAMVAANLAIEVKEKAMSETSEAWSRLDKVQQSLARAVVLSRLHAEGKAVTSMWVLWADVASLVLAVTTQIIFGGVVGIYVFGGGAFFGYWVVNFVVQRWWVRPRLAKLNATEAGIQ
jgi:hypothetical protein